MTRLSLILSLTVPVALVPPLAAIADPIPLSQGMNRMPHLASATADAAPSTLAFMDAAQSMRRGMDVAYTGDADVDFVRTMIAHHESAIAMAKVALEYGRDPDVRKLAEQLISTQQGQVDWMSGWLAQHMPNN